MRPKLLFNQSVKPLTVIYNKLWPSTINYVLLENFSKKNDPGMRN